MGKNTSLEKKKWEKTLQYKNDLNTIIFPRDCNSIDMNLFFAICYKLQHQNTLYAELEKEELYNIVTNNKTIKRHLSKPEFQHVMENAQIHLQSSMFLGRKVNEQNKLEYTTLSFFRRITYIPEDSVLKVVLQDETLYVLNAMLETILNIKGEYTSLELERYNSLTDKASKILFCYLTQYKHTGVCILSDMNTFKKQLGVKPTYRMNNITAIHIKPAVNILSKYFKNLEYTPIKAGRKYTGFKFTFTPVKRIKQKPNWITDNKEDKNKQLYDGQDLDKLVQKKILERIHNGV